MPSPTTASVRPEDMARVISCKTYPIPNFTIAKINQPFGTNYNGFYSELGMLGHNGWDIRAYTGTRLYAVFDGAVTGAYTDSTGGRAVEIATNGVSVPGYEGTYRLRAIYYHLLRWAVSVGDHVTAGQFICEADNTGKYTSGAHLHFGLKIDKKTATGWQTIDHENGFFGAIDPEPFWPGKEWQGYPVDTRYGKSKNVAAEILWRSMSGYSFYQLSKRFWPTERELNALVYGGWSIIDVLNPALLPVWGEKPRS